MGPNIRINLIHRGKKECDFLVRRDINITQAIQVTCSLADPNTKDREISGLLDAMCVYQLKSGLILTLDETDSFDLIFDNQEYHIVVKPIWKWLLE